MATPIFITGFEHGLPTVSVLGAGIVEFASQATIQGTTKRSGFYALQITAETADGYIWINMGSQNVAVASFYFYWPETNGISSIIFNFNSSGSANPNLIYYPISNLFRIWYDGQIADTYSANTYAGDQWIKVDLKYDAVNGTVDWAFNGVSETQVTGIPTATTTYARPGLTYTTSYSLAAYFDDIIISATGADYPIGNHVVVGMRPSSDGSHNNADTYLEDGSDNYIDGSSHYAYNKINDNPWSSTKGTYITQNTIDATKYVEVQFDNPSISGTIFGVRAVAGIGSDGWGDNNGKIYVLDADSQSTTIFDGNHSLEGPDPIQYKGAMITVPSGGWNITQVNALKARMGYSSDVTAAPEWHGMILEVAAETGAAPVGAYISTTMIGTW